MVYYSIYCLIILYDIQIWITIWMKSLEAIFSLKNLFIFVSKYCSGDLDYFLYFNLLCFMGLM